METLAEQEAEELRQEGIMAAKAAEDQKAADWRLMLTTWNQRGPLLVEVAPEEEADASMRIARREADREAKRMG